MEKRRERCRNYTECDKENMLDIVKKYLYIIENKQTDIASVKKKNEAWELVAREYNSQSQTGNRNGANLKLLYENIKKKVKKDKADDKVELYKTGGGTFKRKLDSIGEKFIEINGNETIELLNTYDSTAPLDIIDKSNNDENSMPELPLIFDMPYASGDETCVSTPMLPEKSKEKNQKPSVPHINKKRKLTHPSKSEAYQSATEKIKLEILEIRKKKEQAELDILLIKKRSKELKLREQEQNLDLSNNYY